MINIYHKMIKEDQVSVDQVNTDQVNTDQVNTDQVNADKVTTDRINADKVNADKVNADKVSTDKVSTDKAALENRLRKENCIKILNYHTIKDPVQKDLYYKKHNIRQLLINNSKQKCYLIGNGPNLNTADLLKIEDEMTIACNYFYLGVQERKIDFKPTILCAGDRTITENMLNGHTRYIKDDDLMVIHPSFISGKKPTSTHIRNVNRCSNLYMIDKLNTFYLTKTLPNEKRIQKNIIQYCKKYSNVIPMISMLIAQKLGFKNLYLIGIDCRNVYQHFYLRKTSVSKKYSNEAYQKIYQGFKLRYIELKKQGINVFIDTKKSLFDFIPYYNFKLQTDELYKPYLRSL